MDGLSLKSEKMAKIGGELADCCMLYGGKIIIEGAHILSSRNHCIVEGGREFDKQKSLWRAGILFAHPRQIHLLLCECAHTAAKCQI
jgi:hypothetical protein